MSLPTGIKLCGYVRERTELAAKATLLLVKHVEGLSLAVD